MDYCLKMFSFDAWHDFGKLPRAKNAPFYDGSDVIEFWVHCKAEVLHCWLDVLLWGPRPLCGVLVEPPKISLLSYIHPPIEWLPSDCTFPCLAYKAQKRRVTFVPEPLFHPLLTPTPKLLSAPPQKYVMTPAFTLPLLVRPSSTNPIWNFVTEPCSCFPTKPWTDYSLSRIHPF